MQREVYKSALLDKQAPNLNPDWKVSLQRLWIRMKSKGHLSSWVPCGCNHSHSRMTVLGRVHRQVQERRESGAFQRWNAIPASVKYRHYQRPKSFQLYNSLPRTYILSQLPISFINVTEACPKSFLYILLQKGFYFCTVITFVIFCVYY